MEVENSGEATEDLGSSSSEKCRVCLKKCSELWELFQNDEEIPKKIMAFAAVQVEEGDGLPTAICFSCRRLVHISYDFKRQVERSDATLRQFLISKTSLDQDINASLSQSVDAVITEAIADELQQDGIVNNLEEQIHMHNISNIDETNNQATVHAIEHITVQNFDAEQGTIIFEMTEDCNQENSRDEIIAMSNCENEHSDVDVVKETSSKRPQSSDSLTNGLNQLSDPNTKNEPIKQEELSLPEGSDLSEVEDTSCDQDTTYKEEEEEEEVIKTEVKNNGSSEKNGDLDLLKTVSQTRWSNREGKEENHSDEEEKPLISRTQRKKCLRCIKTFGTKVALERHLIAHKNKTKVRYVCYMCDKQFSNVTKLKNHVINSHNSFKSKVKSSLEDILDKTTESCKDDVERSEKDSSGSMDTSRMEKKNFKFACKVCAKQFTYQKSFISHAKSHSEYKSEMLNSNSEEIGSPEELQENRNDSSSLKVNESDDDDMPLEGLQCTQCGKLFATKRNLKRHISTHSGLKFNCSTCGKEFSRVDKLKEHEQSKHKEEIFDQSDDDDDDNTDNENKTNDGTDNRKKEKNSRPHQCTVCPKAFAQPQSLANHMERHKRVKDTQKRYLCEVCSKCFAQSGSLVAHMRTHTGVKPYVCNVCSRAFTKSTYLQLHLRTHSGEKPYICQYCSRAFARANTLARHITMHTGEAKYHCQICMKSFRRLTSLNEHTYTHTGQRPYACKICTKRYNNAGSLYAHTKKCKAQQLSGQPTTYTVSTDNAAQQNNGSVPQMLIYTQRKLAEDTSVGQIQPTPQFMIANVHGQKPLSTTNVIQPFTVEDPNIYTVNSKQFKNPYYTIYPNM